MQSAGPKIALYFLHLLVCGFVCPIPTYHMHNKYFDFYQDCHTTQFDLHKLSNLFDLELQ